MSILIVDDTKSVRSLIGFYLESDGLGDLAYAEHADQALQMLGIGAPSAEDAQPMDTDLVLMDVVMPQGTDGIEACRRIRANPDTARVPVIVITSDVGDAMLQAAFEAGAVDFIEKPLKKTELLARVRSALRLKRETDARIAREEELLVLASMLEETNQKLHQSNELLQRLSVTDALTGVSNRRSFEDILVKELARARRAGDVVSLVMADIDHFKQFNDRYGHQRGDTCLCEVAKALGTPLKRTCDLLARYGGEEFVAVIPGTDLGGARRIAEMMHRAVADLHIPHEDSSAGGEVSVSFGVATHTPGNGLDATALVEAADKALYEAKAAGRNRIVCADTD